MNLLVIAARQSQTKVAEWRLLGKAAVHKDVTPEDQCTFPGPAILLGGTFKGGNFYRGLFYGGEFNGGDFHGGVFRRGVFNGGTFYGGDFNGGLFTGGLFHEGNFRRGLFHGGEFHGGDFHGGCCYGGTFYGGEFYGGEFQDGIFRGGIFHEGDFRGGCWTRSPVHVQGTQHYVCESDDGHIAAGCMRRPAAWWLENVESCAAEHGYTPEQQAEYREIFEFVASRMRAFGAIAKET